MLPMASACINIWMEGEKKEVEGRGWDYLLNLIWIKKQI